VLILAEALRPAMPGTPAKVIARVELPPWVRVLLPLRAVETVMVPALLFVRALLMVRVVKLIPPAGPVIWVPEPAPKVTPPEPQESVPVLVQSPPKVMRPVPEVMLAFPLMLPVILAILLLVFRAAGELTDQTPPTVRVPASGVLVPAPEKVRLG